MNLATGLVSLQFCVQLYDLFETVCPYAVTLTAPYKYQNIDGFKKGTDKTIEKYHIPTQPYISPIPPEDIILSKK